MKLESSAIKGNTCGNMPVCLPSHCENSSHKGYYFLHPALACYLAFEIKKQKTNKETKLGGKDTS